MFLLCQEKEKHETTDFFFTKLFIRGSLKDKLNTAPCHLNIKWPINNYMKIIMDTCDTYFNVNKVKVLLYTFGEN